MEEFFHGLSSTDFKEQFSEDEQCYKFLADLKWGIDFHCKKCGHKNYCMGKLPYSRRCTRCKKDESATAHTVFHRCKLPLHQAFYFAWLICNNPKVSSYELNRLSEIRHMTCYHFKMKIMECINKNKQITVN